ncbi:cell wall-active antibiotics response protein LiaF [Paenibacillus hodogayensis]|uniref:Cell wall-active antibiotics response protein LiaF n=1 Tax=Paenibacillus hodogayensis TaxID=279208 RepID=A0ABV5VUY2_9BACL
MGNRNRNTAIMLIVAGLFILIEHYVSFFTIAALLFIALGIYKIRSSPDKTGYVILVVGVFLLFSGHFTFILSVVLISLGLFYMKSKQAHREHASMKQSLLESFKRDKEPWELKNISMWNVVGEVYMDLSLVMLEEKETTVVLQGVLGDVDIVVPEFIGVSVNASALIGQIKAGNEKETGLVNKVVWQSPNYESSDQKVKLIISYLVGDIDIKLV